MEFNLKDFGKSSFAIYKIIQKEIKSLADINSCNDPTDTIRAR